MTATSARYKWYVVAMLWWMAFFNYADRQAIYSVFPLLEKDFHLSRVELGMLGSSFALVYGLAAPFVGNIIDRVRRKTAILVGLQTWSLICMATALSRNFPTLVFFRAAEGLGETAYFPASMSLISDYHGKGTRSRAMGTHQTSVYVGVIAGGFLAGLIAKHLGWRAAFLIFGGCGVLLGIVLHRLLIEPERGAADLAEVAAGAVPHHQVRVPVREFVRMILGRPTVLFLMAAFMCENFTAMVIFAWMPTFLYEKFHLDLAMAALTATLYIQVTSLLGSPLGGWMADSLRRRVAGGRILVQAFGIFWEAPFAVLCALTGNLGWLIAGLLCWGLFKGLYEANIFASVFDVIRPEARGTATGFMNMMGWLAGGATAPVLVGWLSERLGLSVAIALAASAYWLAALLLTVAALRFAPRDTERLRQELAAEASASAPVT
jgi:MFS family permease